MSESENKAPDGQSTDQKKAAKVWRLLLLAGLWTLVAISLGFIGFGFFGIGIVSFYGTVKLSGYCRKRYQVSLLPQSFTARIRKSEIIQIFFVRPRNRVSSLILGWIAIFGLIFTIVFGQGLLFVPVLELEQMEVNTGTLEQIKRRPTGRRSHSCGDRFDIRTASGKSIRYYDRLSEQVFSELKSLKGREITVWSQIGYGFPPCIVYKNSWQIKVEGRLVKAYDKKYPEQFHRQFPKIVAVTGLLSFLCLVRIWFVHRNEQD